MADRSSGPSNDRGPAPGSPPQRSDDATVQDLPALPAAAAAVADDPARRELLAKAALGCAGAATLLAAWPLGGALVAPDLSDGPAQEQFVDVAAEKDVTDTRPLRKRLRAVTRDGWASALHDVGAVWLLRTPGGLVALSAACPHLGCAVEQDAKGFFCPCHESRFDARGARLTGPSPRGLDRLPVRVDQGRVLVQISRSPRRGSR